MTWNPRWALTAAIVVALLALSACDSGSTPQSGPTPPGGSPSVTTTASVDPDARPIPAKKLNVIVIVTDDQNDISCRHFGREMPKTAAWLVAGGTCYDNATVTSPSCCPSRAVLQTGQFGHNNGVQKQVQAPLLNIADTVQQHLTDAGWNTYGTGKFFNGESAFTFESGQKSDGFLSSDFWNVSDYYDFDVWSDSQHKIVKVHGVNTTVLSGRLSGRFIASQADSSRPFYDYVAFKAPHTQNALGNNRHRFPTPTPKNRDRPVPPFHFHTERDVRDKLKTFHQPLHSVDYQRDLYAARIRAGYDIDDQMGRLHKQLARQGLLKNTAIFYTSDNGYHLGQNHWETKGDPYQTAMNVPMVAYLPGTFKAGAIDTRPVGLIDIAPTVYQLTGVDPGHVLDGHSLLDPYRRPYSYFEMKNENDRVSRAEGGIRPGQVPGWGMIRRGNTSYIEYYTDGGKMFRQEFYRDAPQEDNLLYPATNPGRPSAAELQRYEKILHAARTCAGTIESHATNPCP